MSYLKCTIVIVIIALSVACNSNKERTKHTELIPNELVLKHLHYLSSDALNGRRIGSKGGKLAQDYIVSELEQNQIAPLGNTYLAAFSIENLFNDKQGSNVVGFIKGTEFPKRFIVLSAHFDHIGGHGNNIYNGADDNASGTAALLYYAKLLKQSPLRYSVILLFTDGEEANLKGANAFIKQNPNLVANVVLNINLDMIAGNKNTKRLHYLSRGLEKLMPKEKIAAFQQQPYPIQLKSGFRQLRRNKKREDIKWEIASDHGVFYRHNIAFIYYGVGSHKNYHQTTDNYENINHQFYLLAVAVIFHQINFIDQNL